MTGLGEPVGHTLLPSFHLHPGPDPARVCILQLQWREYGLIMQSMVALLILVLLAGVMRLYARFRSVREEGFN